MIAIVDYGVGNLYSLERSFHAIGEAVTVSADPKVLSGADKILLPGVGAFGDAAEKLRATGLDQLVKEQAAQGKPLMGICLGMQLLFEEGHEYGIHKGLGLIPGQVRPISEVIPGDLKIPHMGWNALELAKSSPLMKDVKQGDCVYFVHSFHAANCRDHVIATAEYGAHLTAAVQRDNVFGCQFHPEKSGAVGLKILRSFAQMKG
ncbi:MAG: imidazole glycerol phosphate synthase subunit HisH [Oscillospiraceae bacterium]|nr:imidazole glycerol phosphate synthase subunit HisH [Oscillospiraceae bacterium]